MREFVKDFVYRLTHEGNTTSAAFQLAFYSIVVYQIVFIFFQSIFFRRREYYFYLGYMVAIIPYFWSHTEKTLGLTHFFSDNPNWREYFDKPFIVINFIAYFNFARYFLDVPTLQRSFNAVIQQVIIVFSFLGIVSIVLRFTEGHKVLADVVFTSLQATLFFVVAYIIYHFFKIRRSRLKDYMLAGVILVIVGCTSSMALFILRELQLLPSYFIPSIPAQICIMVEVMVFSTGLVYKTNLLEKEKIIAEKNLRTELIEKENLRQRIAADLHDDMGATLSSISIYANVAKKNMREGLSKASLDYVERIYKLSNEMQHSLREMAWYVKPGSDSLEALWDRIKDFAVPLLVSQDIEIEMVADDLILKTPLSMLQRRNIFLLFKEGINNTIKYAACSKVRLQASKTDDNQIQFLLTDNGVGFDPFKINVGMGLKKYTKKSD